MKQSQASHDRLNVIPFSQILREIDNELPIERQTAAMVWADRTFNNAWSRTADMYQLAIDEWIRTKNRRVADLAAVQYRSKILELIQRYKAHHRIDDAEVFLEMLSQKGRGRDSERGGFGS